MVDGLQVVLTYRGAKYDRVASAATLLAAFAILKKDLAHLRVHSPSQKNIRRVGGSFFLHWPEASISTKTQNNNSLHTRWFKLCDDDPEVSQLRHHLSIESIIMTQDGFLIRSTTGVKLTSQDAPPGAFVVGLHNSSSQKPAPSTTPPVAPPPPLSSFPVQTFPLPPKPSFPPLPRLPPDVPKPPNLKRRLNSIDSQSNSTVTRQKLNVSEMPTTIISPLLPTHVPSSTSAAVLPPSCDNGTASRPVLTLTQTQPGPESEVRTREQPHPLHVPIPVPIPAPVIVSSTPSDTAPRPSSAPRPPLPSHPNPGSPQPSSSSSGNGDNRSRRRERDVHRLMRELRDMRHQLAALKAQEQVILDDLERLGERPESPESGVSRDELLRLEAELRVERAGRVRAEQALSDVERECRTPFVVPALFQAFLSISELTS